MHILFVDDDNEDHFIMRDAFREIGVQDSLAFARDGEEVMAHLEQSILCSDLPSLIVLDLNMPRMNGTQVLRMLKSDPRFSSIPVVIYSTSLNAFERDECLLLGAESYIIKPVTFSECVRAAQGFFDRASSSNPELI